MGKLFRFFKAFLILSSILALACQSEPNEAIQIIEDPALQKLDELNKTIRDYPNNSNAYWNRAVYYLEAGSFDLAAEDLKRAIGLDSTQGKYYASLGDLHFKEANFQQAKIAYEQAVLLDSNQLDALLQLSVIAWGLSDMDQALAHINQALSQNAMLPFAYYMKGKIYLDLKDTSRAVSSFQTSIEVDADYYDGYIKLGELYATVNSPLAMEYYNRAIELQPNNMEGLYNKSVYLQKIEQYDATYPLYEQMLSIDSNAYFAHYNRGYNLLVTDSSYTLAIEAFQNALEIYPYYYQAYYNIGLCYENLNETNKALESYRKSLEINPQYDLAAKGMSRLLE